MMPRTLLDKLKRLEESVHPSSAVDKNKDRDAELHSEWSMSMGPSTGDADDTLQEQFLNAGFEQLETPYGVCWRRLTSFDLLTHHGKISFAEATTTDFSYYKKWIDESVDISRLRYYDVETNGLGTGAGTFPFLHTLGYFEEDELVFAQYFLDDYDAEAAVLWALGTFHLPPDAIIVTYNGKSFDWPLLQNRRVMHQLKRLEHAQLDLLHPSRRLWRRQLQNVRLSSLECHVLGVSRIADLPGSEAPERYMQYLEQRDISRIEPVLSHNLMDVCSLVTLQVEIARHLNGEIAELTSDVHLALARWYDVWHDVHAAATSYRAAYEREDADWSAHWLYSLFLKRRQDYATACILWTQMATKYPAEIEPLIELAKYYEHRRRDFAAAQEVVVKAIERRRNHEDFSGIHDGMLKALEHRLRRIRVKRAR